MLVDYPREWDKYFVSETKMIFSKSTPRDIIEQAKRVNRHIFRDTDKYFFFFEDENESLT